LIFPATERVVFAIRSTQEVHMELKEGLLALTVAAALGAPAAFAQQGQTEEKPGDVTADSQLQQQADASTSLGQQQASAGQQDSFSSRSEQAMSDVPPPVDRETVRSIQQALSEQGQDVRADGIWGAKTHQALMQFQRDNNLDASGQINAGTMAALDLMDQQQTAGAEQQESAQQTASAGQQEGAQQSASAQDQQSGEQQQAALEEQQQPGSQPQSSSQ
jgi:hypothetical protein